MAELATVARPYAEALFRVAKAGNLGAWSELVSEMGQIAAVPDMKAVADDPNCLLYTSPSPRDGLLSRMPSSA